MKFKRLKQTNNERGIFIGHVSPSYKCCICVYRIEAWPRDYFIITLSAFPYNCCKEKSSNPIIGRQVSVGIGILNYGIWEVTDTDSKELLDLFCTAFPYDKIIWHKTYDWLSHYEADDI